MTEEKTLMLLRKLKAHAESAAKIGNKAEACAFREKCEALLAKHGLTAKDLEPKAEESRPTVTASTPGLYPYVVFVHFYQGCNTVFWPM